MPNGSGPLVLASHSLFTSASRKIFTRLGWRLSKRANLLLGLAAHNRMQLNDRRVFSGPKIFIWRRQLKSCGAATFYPATLLAQRAGSIFDAKWPASRPVW